MNGHGKSDRPIVPEKHPNNRAGAPVRAEGVEGRGLAKGNPRQQTRVRTQDRVALQSAQERIRQAVLRDREQRLISLWHHVHDVRRLREAYLSMRKGAAAGIDGMTWRQYGEDLEDNLADLSVRLKRGAYRAKPVRRVYIPKADGRQRPLGIPVLEDKIVQRATVAVLNAVYEVEFKGFSYGFRPGRHQHHALDAVAVGIIRKKVSWVLDADIRGFFDAVDHDWLMKFVEHRIADTRVIRHIKKWLNAGVMEDEELRRAELGTPQGGSISPLLANIYLHYALDLWVDHWRKRHARGDVIIVRYADDFVVGFQYRHEAEQFRQDLEARLRKFKLELHPEKTRLIEFGRFAASSRRKRGEGKPETFDFLGFTHMCGVKRNGKFAVKRKTARKKLTAKLKELKEELRQRLHDPVPEVGKWLRAVVRGHVNYYGVPWNIEALNRFRWEVSRLWLRTLRRRSQKSRTTWERMTRLINRWLPPARIVHPYPEQRLCLRV